MGVTVGYKKFSIILKAILKMAENGFQQVKPYLGNKIQSHMGIFKMMETRGVDGLVFYSFKGISQHSWQHVRNGGSTYMIHPVLYQQ